MDIKENTVSAVGQVASSSELFFLGAEDSPLRILIVGNSITRHGPLAEIGWNRDWGMAASAPEKDYVHRLYSKLTEGGYEVYMRIRQASFWERNYRASDVLSHYDEERAFDADIVIFRLGDNVADEDKPYYKSALEKFMSHICPSGRALYVTSFWKNEGVDEDTFAVARERGEVCLDGCLSDDETNTAKGQFEHGGVAGHPSDKGMEAIAELIFTAIKDYLRE